MVQQVCLFCNTALDATGGSGDNQEEISHGLCSNCVPKFMAGRGKQFTDFLDALPAPILLVDDDVKVIGANRAGLNYLGKKAEEIRGRMGGEVFECRYSKLPGGCGRTVHCKTCTIRLAVTKTATTGQPCIRVPAHVDLGSIVGEFTIRYLISTEKINNVVLLRIEEVDAKGFCASDRESAAA